MKNNSLLTVYKEYLYIPYTKKIEINIRSAGTAIDKVEAESQPHRSTLILISDLTLGQQPDNSFPEKIARQMI